MTMFSLIARDTSLSPTPGDSDIGTGAEAGADADAVPPVAEELQDP
jgi:hypothetical protein